MAGEFEIEETVDIDCDDDGKFIASVTLGTAEDGVAPSIFLSQFNQLLDRVPPEFREKAGVHTWSSGVEIRYERPATEDEVAKDAEVDRAHEAERLEARRRQYEILRREFDPAYDPSGEAPQPPDYSAQAQLDHRTSDYQKEAA